MANPLLPVRRVGVSAAGGEGDGEGRPDVGQRGVEYKAALLRGVCVVLEYRRPCGSAGVGVTSRDARGRGVGVRGEGGGCLC